MDNSLYLAIDQGGQSTRVAVYTPRGERLCIFSAACATQQRVVEGLDYPYIEQDPVEILTGIQQALESVREFLGRDIARLKGVSFAGQGSSLLCWDSNTGAALSQVLSWQDIRGQDYLTPISLSNQQLQARTGLRLSAHYGASKIRWCLEHNSALVEPLRNNRLSIGPIVSYIFWHLCKSAQPQEEKSRVDPGHAQRTLLWNMAANDWDETLLALFKIPRAILPECMHHNSHFGDLQLGGQRIPLCAAARDQGASLFARGLPEPNSAYINMGTGAFIQRVSNQLQAPEGLLVSPLWLPEQPEAKRYYAWEATVNGAAAALPFIQSHTGLPVTPQDIAQALSLTPNLDCYFLNAVGGLSAPYWRTDLESSFSDGLNPQEKILAWIESVIFQSVVNLELMQSLGPIDKIIISGGFSNANAVCQKIADLTQAAVHRSDNTDATVQGAACMAAGLPPQWQPPLNDEVFNPQPNPSLKQRFNRWQAAMGEWLGEGFAK